MLLPPQTYNMHPAQERKIKKTLIIRALVHKSCAYLHKSCLWAAGCSVFLIYLLLLLLCRRQEQKGHSKHEGGGQSLRGRAARDPWTRRVQGAKELRDSRPPTRGGQFPLMSDQSECQGLKRGVRACRERVREKAEEVTHEPLTTPDNDSSGSDLAPATLSEFS